MLPACALVAIMLSASMLPVAGGWRVSDDAAVTPSAPSARASRPDGGPASVLPMPPAPAGSVPALPILFEPNRGQAAPDVAFLASPGAPPLRLRPDGFSIAVGGADELGIAFVGADPAALLHGVGPTGSYSSYFGNQEMQQGVPHYERVVYDGLYPGIDAVFYVAADGAIEFDYIAAPGADIAQLVLRPTAGTSFQRNPDGGLRLSSPDGHLDLRAPVAHQPGLGPVEAAFGLLEDGDAAFLLGPYDPGATLIIDPKLIFSSYLGGSATDGFTAVKALDGFLYATGTSSSGATKCNGAACPAGMNADSSGLMVAKFNPDALTPATALIWVAVLAGGSATAADIDVEPANGGYPGGIYIAGTASGGYYINTATNSAFQVAPSPWTPSCTPIYQDAILTRIALDGLSAPYSTYIGGGYLDGATGVVGGGGNAVIVGFTAFNSDHPFPVVLGFQAQHNGPPPSGSGGVGTCGSAGHFGGYDAFMARIDTAAPPGPAPGQGNPQSLWWSTMLGGGATDFATDVALDGDGAVWATGIGTQHTVPFPTVNPYPTTTGGNEAFLVKAAIDPDSDLLVEEYGTLFGGASTDTGQALAVVGTGAALRVYIAGATQSTSFPQNGAAYDTVRDNLVSGYVAKLDPNQVGAAQLVKTTFIEDVGTGVASDVTAALTLQADGTNVHVQGYTSAGSRFPRLRAWPGLAGGPNNDVFAADLTDDLTQLRMATALGSPSNDIVFALGSTTSPRPGSWHSTTGHALVAQPSSTTGWPITQSGSQPVLNPGVHTYQSAPIGTSLDAAIASLKGPSEPYAICGAVSPAYRGQAIQFTWAPPAPYVHTQAIETYDAMAATDPNYGLDLTSFRWDFDYDGVTPNWHVPANGLTTPSYTYSTSTAPGPHTVLLEVRDTAGLIGRGLCVVNLAQRLPTVVSCTATPSPAGVGWSVALAAQSPQDLDGTVAGHSWQLTPDGSFVAPSTATSTTPTVTFPTQGQKTVRVTVQDNNGGSTLPLRAVAFGGGQWVAVGDGGTIYASPDGNTWAARSSGVAANLRGIAFAQSTWVAVGDSGTILTSPDATVWTPRLHAVSTNLNGIAYGGTGNRWAAVGAGGLVYHTTDAVTVAWTLQTTPITTALNGVAATSAILVAAGDAGRILTSPDGLTWTSRTSGTTVALRSVFMQLGVLPVRWTITGDAGAILTSGDSGTNWGERVLRGVVHDGTRWVAVGERGITLNSVDGAATWRLGSNTGASAAAHINGVASSATYTVAVGDSGLVFGTSDGSAWTQNLANVVSSSTQLNGIVHSANGPSSIQWMVATSTGRFVYSTSSTFLSYSSFWPSSAVMNAVAYHSGAQRWVGVGAGAFVSSVAGPSGPWDSNWPGGATLYGIATNGETAGTNVKWVAVGAGIQRTSTAAAGTGFSAATAIPGSPTMRAVTYGAGTWVAVGDGGVILTSPDGPSISWTQQTSPTTRSLRTVAFAGGLFVAAGQAGTVLTSPDGVAWTPRSADPTGAVHAAATSGSYGPTTRMAAVGQDGLALASQSAVVWTDVAAGLVGNTATLRGVASDGSSWMVVGQPDVNRNGANTIYTSPDTAAWTERMAGASALCQVTINNLPPPLTCSGPATVVAGAVASFTASGGAPPYSWSADGGATWTGSPTAFSGTPFEATWPSPGGPHTATVTTGASSATCSITVTPAPLACSGPATVSVASASSFTASGGSGPGTYSWSAAGDASWTGSPTAFAGSPFAPSWPAPGGPHTVTVTSGAQSATCDVTVVTGPPPLACSGPASVTAGVAGTFTASGGTPPYAWTASGGASWAGAPTPVSAATFNPTWPGAGGPVSATVTAGAATSSCSVTVDPPPNTPPLAIDDPDYRAVQNGQLQATASVLGNDIDNDPGDSVIGAVLCPGFGPTFGTLSLMPGGTFTYTPAAGFTGFDSFRYRAVDASSNAASANCATVTIETRVDNAPTADFAWSPAPPSAGQPVSFMDLSTDPDGDAITTWSWTFGDGASATAGAPSHSYGEAGSYTVCLTVGDPWGLASPPRCRSVSVAAAAKTSSTEPPPPAPPQELEQEPLLEPGDQQEAPLLVLIAGPGTAVEGDTVILTASTPDVPRALFRWRQVLGPALVLDGGDSAVMRFTATAEPVSFLVEARSGSRQGSAVAAVQPRHAAEALAADLAAPATGTAGDLITLDASGSTGSGPMSYRWLQLDGPTGDLRAGAGAAATFRLPGSGTVRLGVVVTDGRAEAMATATIVVTERGPSQDLGSTPAGFATRLDGSTVTFTPLVPATVYEWSFGDGSTTTSNGDVSHTYGKSGTFAVTLRANGAAAGEETVRIVEDAARPDAEMETKARESDIGWFVAALAGVIVVGLAAVVLVLQRRRARQGTQAGAPTEPTTRR